MAQWLVVGRPAVVSTQRGKAPVIFTPAYSHPPSQGEVHSKGRASEKGLRRRASALAGIPRRRPPEPSWRRRTNGEGPGEGWIDELHAPTARRRKHPGCASPIWADLLHMPRLAHDGPG